MRKSLARLEVNACLPTMPYCEDGLSRASTHEVRMKVQPTSQMDRTGAEDNNYMKVYINNSYMRIFTTCFLIALTLKTLFIFCTVELAQIFTKSAFLIWLMIKTLNQYVYMCNTFKGQVERRTLWSHTGVSVGEG